MNEASGFYIKLLIFPTPTGQGVLTITLSATEMSGKLTRATNECGNRNRRCWIITLTLSFS
jgi:hypothetical protein